MIRTLTFVALALLFAACGGNGDSTPAPTQTSEARGGAIVIAPGAPLRIGVSVAMSGEQANIGADIGDAVDLAVADAGGAVRGHPIEAVRKDDGCTDAERALTVARTFIVDESVAGVIGPMCTIGSQAANHEYARASTVHITPSSTRVELSAQGDAYFFRTSWQDEAQARLQARYAIDRLRATQAIIIDDAEPYGTGLAEGIAVAYVEHGGQVVSRERIDRGTTDFGGLARQIASANPDVVFFSGLNPEGALLVRALRDAGYTMAFIGPDALVSARDFLVTAGNKAEGAILTGGAAPDEAYVAKFSGRYLRPISTPFVLQANDAVRALIAAIDAVATARDDGALVIDRVALAAKLRAQEYAGLTGRVSFDERGDRRGETAAELGLAVYTVTGGQFVAAP